MSLEQRARQEAPGTGALREGIPAGLGSGRRRVRVGVLSERPGSHLYGIMRAILRRWQGAMRLPNISGLRSDGR
jgi:hypothetical protein